MNNSVTISDGWEEVEGDDFSVVSVPRSDGLKSVDQNSTQDCVLSVGTLTDDTVNEHSEYATTRTVAKDSNDTQDENIRGDEIERRGMDMKDVVEPEELPLRSLYEFLDSDDVNPGSLGQINASLIELIEEIISFLKVEGNFKQAETHKIKSGCQALLVHLQCLSPILEGYSKHYEPGRVNVDLPLDPGLESWMSNLTAEMLTLREELQNSTIPRAPGMRETRYLQDTSRFEEAVKIFTTQMDELMPVIQGDFNDFHTGNMNFLTHQGDSQASTKEEDISSDQEKRMQSDKDLWNLRHELYDLKDQVTTCVTELEFHRQQKTDQGVTVDFSLLTGIESSYRFIKSSLDVILSNHASDWIDNSLDGGLTYAEFCRLSPDTIRSLHLQLKDTVKNVSNELFRARSLRYMNDPDNILDQDSTVSFNDALLYELYSMEEELVSIFRLRKPPMDVQEEN